jgi:hypothetical protein
LKTNHKLTFSKGLKVRTTSPFHWWPPGHLYPPSHLPRVGWLSGYRCILATLCSLVLLPSVSKQGGSKRNTISWTSTRKYFFRFRPVTLHMVMCHDLFLSAQTESSHQDNRAIRLRHKQQGMCLSESIFWLQMFRAETCRLEGVPAL